MPFLLLLFLMFACLPEVYPAPLALWINPGESAALTGLAMGMVAGWAFLIALWTRWRLHHEPQRREVVLRRYAAFRLYHMIGLCLVYALVLFGLGWGWAIQTSCETARWHEPATRMVIPGAELLILAPFVLGLMASWACFYDAERTLHDTGPHAGSGQSFWSRWAYVSFHTRHSFGMVFLPIVLMMVEKGLRREFPELQKEWPLSMAALGMVLLAAVFVSLPWILRLVLGLHSLPAGPLRDRLLRAAQRLKFRCSDILLWNTRGGVVNAMVVGIVPSVRYVLLTDRLISDLTPDEVEAVFGHEVGHVKHHHMIYYMGFLLISLIAVGALWTEVEPLLGLGREAPEYLAAMPFIAVLGTYVFVVFGFLSRRCERQADIYGCRAVSCALDNCAGHAEDLVPVAGGRGLCPTGIRIFIEALEKVAKLNGISRDRPGWLQSWQHSTIARRVEFLQRMLADPTLEPRFQRRVRLVKWSLFIGLGLVLALLTAVQGWEAWAAF